MLIKAYEFEGMEEATLKDLAFLSRSSRESDKVGPDGCVSTVWSKGRC